MNDIWLNKTTDRMVKVVSVEDGWITYTFFDLNHRVGGKLHVDSFTTIFYPMPRLDGEVLTNFWDPNSSYDFRILGYVFSNYFYDSVKNLLWYPNFWRYAFVEQQIFGYVLEEFR